MLRIVMRKGRAFARRVWRRMFLARQAPVLDEADILLALRTLPFTPPQVLMVHSSLSACGFVRGGAAAVIRALREWHPGGTLAMPTHTYCYPDEQGRAPLFDPERTPSRVGKITDEFWRMDGVKRSLHPSHSLACLGPESEKLTRGHEHCDTPCGKGTPYEMLVNHDASVLMFGTDLDTYTLFHTAEDAACVPYLYQDQALKLRYRQPGRTGETAMSMKRQDMTRVRRFREMDSWLAERGLAFKTKLGKSSLLWLPHARAVHEALVQALHDDPLMLLKPAADPQRSGSSCLSRASS